MKAAVVVANEDVQYQEVEEPQVTPGHVKIKVRYSGICGSDIPRVLNHGVHFYPIVLGHEFSGDVVEVGEGVTKVKVGDRVKDFSQFQLPQPHPSGYQPRRDGTDK